MLDALSQRIVGVLVEKELTVPDTYPLTENSLITGCNQKSNRDPEMSVTAGQMHPALLALRGDGWIVRVDGSGRVVRYRHKAMERLNIQRDQLIVLTELLLRGPQAPGALKPRVARMGLHAEPSRIEAILEDLATFRPAPLVERLPRRRRERDERYGHLLGPRPMTDEERADDAEGSDISASERLVPSRAPSHTPSQVTTPIAGSGHSRVDELSERVERLEEEMAELRKVVDSLRGMV
jgi:uncharacterized protein YceH (UPF0502 family)